MNAAHLYKRFGDKVVLEDVSLTVPDGAVVCLMAPSGRGKTTLLRCIAGLEMPDSGTVTGVPERLGFVFQEDRLCPQLDAVENVRLVTGRAMSRPDIEAHLRELGLADCLDQRAAELSGGQRTKILLGKLLLEKTYPGRFLRAVGENPETAEFIGINSRRIKIFAYMICSFMMTVTAAFMICYNHAATPFSGSEYMSDSLIACCAGGFSLRGGNGRLEEALAAALALVIFDDGIRTLGASQGITGFIKAVMLLIVLVINFKDKLQEM